MAPRTDDVTHNSLLLHHAMNQMLQGKVILVMVRTGGYHFLLISIWQTSADDVFLSPILRDAFVNTSVIVTTSIPDTYQQLKNLLHDTV